MYVPLRWRVPKIRKNASTAMNEMPCITTASAAVVGARPFVRTRLNTRSGAVSSDGGWTNSVTRYSLKTMMTVSYTHLRAHETPEHLVCRLLLEKKKKN